MLRTADKRLFVSRRLSTAFGPGKLARDPIPYSLPPITGYSAWLDASNESGGVTLDSTGFFLTSWNDLSGNGLHATPPATAAPAVARMATLLKKRRVVQLNAVGGSALGRMDTNIDASDRTQTSFVVGMAHRVSIGNQSLLSSSATGGRYLRINSTGKVDLLKDGTATLFSTTSLVVTAGVPFCIALILDTNTIEIRVNSGTPESTAESTTFTAARTTRIGDRSSFTEALNGFLGEIIVYPTALSSGDVGSVMAYLMTKWGIS